MGHHQFNLIRRTKNIIGRVFRGFWAAVFVILTAICSQSLSVNAQNMISPLGNNNLLTRAWIEVGNVEEATRLNRASIKEAKDTAFGVDYTNTLSNALGISVLSRDPLYGEQAIRDLGFSVDNTFQVSSISEISKQTFLNNYSAYLIMKNDLDEALGLLEEIQLAPGAANNSAISCSVNKNLGTAFVKSGDLESAAKSYQAALRSRAGDVFGQGFSRCSVEKDLATVYFRMGKTEEALDTYEDIRRITDENIFGSLRPLNAVIQDGDLVEPKILYNLEVLLGDRVKEQSSIDAIKHYESALDLVIEQDRVFETAHEKSEINKRINQLE